MTAVSCDTQNARVKEMPLPRGVIGDQNRRSSGSWRAEITAVSSRARQTEQIINWECDLVRLDKYPYCVNWIQSAARLWLRCDYECLYSESHLMPISWCTRPRWRARSYTSQRQQQRCSPSFMTGNRDSDSLRAFRLKLFKMCLFRSLDGTNTSS